MSFSGLSVFYLHQYGAFESGNAENEVYVCTERAAQNLSFQENANEFGKVDKICDLSGMDVRTIYRLIYLYEDGFTFFFLNNPSSRRK